MTREQLETIAKPTFVWHIIGEYTGDYDDVIDAREDLLDILEIAYNKGIEDAVGKFVEESYYITSTQADLLMEVLESLKIK